jgi:CheY-like chemotaxis protein
MTNNALNSKLLDLKKTFVRYVSHEIRSPLHVVEGGLAIIAKELADSNASVEVLTMIKDISDSASTSIAILDDLINYESLDSGSFKLALAEKPLNTILRTDNFIQQLQIFARSHSVDFKVFFQDQFIDMESALLYQTPQETSIFPSRAYLYLDELRFQQVIRNLVTTAVQLASRESGRVEVNLKECRDISEVTSNNSLDTAKLVGSFRVEVVIVNAAATEDILHSFSEQNQSSFDKRTLHGGNAGGGGSELGLWISRRIIHLHGGVLKLQSAPSVQGSMFYLCLPVFANFDNCKQFKMTSIKISPEIDATLVRNVWTTISRSFGSSRLSKHGSGFTEIEATATVSHSLQRNEVDVEPVNLKILVVDDSSINRKINIKLVSSEPALIPDPVFVEAEDGEDALECMRASIEEGEPFNLVLIDYVMNKIHGPQAVMMMRRDYSFQGVIIGVTGNALTEYIKHFIDQGANYFLIKPLRKKKLIELFLTFLF